MKLRKLSLIKSLLIASSSLCITSVWGETELDSEFVSIGHTPREILNLDPKNVDVIPGDKCGGGFLLIERDVFNRLGKINNREDFYRLLKDEKKEVIDFAQHFSLNSLEEGLYIPQEWQEVKDYPVPMRTRLVGVIGNVILNTALGQLGAGLTHVASNYVIVNFGEPLAEMAAQAAIAFNHRVINVVWPSQAQSTPNKSWFRGLFEKTTDNFEYTNTKAEMLRRVGGISDTTVKYATLVGQGVYSGVKSVASFTASKISNWWNKKKA